MTESDPNRPFASSFAVMHNPAFASTV